MDVNYFKSKNYEIPLNVPKSKKSTYIEVIDKGYAKYLEIINLCDKFIMYHQFYKLVELLEGQNRKRESNKTIGKRIIYKLQELGFIGTYHINRNKFIYLRKSGIALADGDYKGNGRVTLSKDLKNDKFKVSILKVEYFLHTGEILHSSNMMKQLKKITKDILDLINKDGNKYRYDAETIKEILNMNDFLEIQRYLEEKPEYINKLDVIRGLWVNLGGYFRKLMLQRQTIKDRPAYLKIFINHNGQILLHYVPTIAVFDVSHDTNYYKDKLLQLFNVFYSIPDNELRDVQKNYTLSNRETMGYLGTHHIGYKILLIGADKEVLAEKKETIDEDFDRSPNSPLMSRSNIVPLNIGEYIYHASRKGNKFSKKHNERIDRLILNSFKQLNIIKGIDEKDTPLHENNKSKTAREEILDLVK